MHEASNEQQSLFFPTTITREEATTNSQTLQHT